MNKSTGSNVDPLEAQRVAAAARGVEAARRELFEAYRDVAFHAAFRITGRREDALDAVQDGFIKAFAGLATFQGESGFKTWLLRIVSNRALDLLRARKVRLAASLDGEREDGELQGAVAATIDAPDRGLEQAELAQRVASAMEELPPDQRAVFSLFASGELTYAQIAEALGIPMGTVMSRLFHARRKLQERLADLGPRGAVESATQQAVRTAR